MHQSGHSRAHSMQTVQFSSSSAMTPRARVGGASLTWGYCTVTAGRSIVPRVTPRPLIRPGSWGLATSEHHLQDGGRGDVHQRDRDEVLPRERLQLVLAQAGVGEAEPEDE